MVEPDELTGLFAGKDICGCEFSTLAGIMYKNIYRADELIRNENEEDACVYLIKKGKVKIFRQLGDKEKILLILGRGMYFGNFFKADGNAYKLTISAMEDSEVFAFRKSALDSLAADNPALGVKLMSEVLFSMFDIYRKLDSKLINMVQSLMQGQVLDEGAEDRSVLIRPLQTGFGTIPAVSA